MKLEIEWTNEPPDKLGTYFVCTEKRAKSIKTWDLVADVFNDGHTQKEIRAMLCWKDHYFRSVDTVEFNKPELKIMLNVYKIRDFAERLGHKNTSDICEMLWIVTRTFYNRMSHGWKKADAERLADTLECKVKDLEMGE